MREKNKHKLSKEEKEKVLREFAKWVDEEQEKGRELGFIYDKSKDMTRDENK